MDHRITKLPISKSEIITKFLIPEIQTLLAMYRVPRTYVSFSRCSIRSKEEDIKDPLRANTVRWYAEVRENRDAQEVEVAKFATLRNVKLARPNWESLFPPKTRNSLPPSGKRSKPFIALRKILPFSYNAKK